MVGTGVRIEPWLGSHPVPATQKNLKKCDELVKNGDELVKGAFFAGEKNGHSGDTASGRTLLSRRHQGAEEEFG